MTERRKRHRMQAAAPGTPGVETAVGHTPAPFRTPVAMATPTVRRIPDDAEYPKGEFAAPEDAALIRRTADDDGSTIRRRGAGALPQTRPRRGAAVGELDSLEKHRNPHYEQSLKTPAKAKKLLGIEDGMYVGTPDGKFSGASSATKRDAVDGIRATERQKQEDNKKAGVDKNEVNVHQPVADLGEIYAHTAMLEAEFKHQVETIAAQTKGKAVFRPGGKMKSIDRTLEKITADYGGDVSRIVDLTGGSISFSSPDDLVLGYGAIRSNPMFKVVRLKNGLERGKSYGDINMSLEMGGTDFEVVVDGEKKTEHYAGFIIELQLHLAPIIGAKEVAHKDYEEQRKIGAKYGQQTDRSRWDAADRGTWEDLETKMVRTYGVAWAQLGDAKAIGAKLGAAIPKIDAK